MMIPQLTIHSVQGQIGIKSSIAKLDIRSSSADLTIQQPKAELKIQKTPSQLNIDQTQAWNNLNLKSAIVRISEAANAGRQAVMDGIARRVRQGDELMNIQNKGNPIARQAVENSQHHGGYDTGHVPPFEAVKIHYQPSQLNIQWQTHAPVIEARVSSPTMNFQPGQVNVFMQQYSSVTISGGIVDTKA